MDPARRRVLVFALLAAFASRADAQISISTADVVSREVTVFVPPPRPAYDLASRPMVVAAGPTIATERRSFASRELSVDVPLGDLVISSVDVPASGVAGKSFEFRWRVENAGGGALDGPWVDRITITPETPPGPETVLADIEHPFLASAGGPCDEDEEPCGVYEKIESLTLPATPGTFRIQLAADADGAVVEGDETNNVVERTIQVRPAFLADLDVTLITAPGGGADVFAGSMVAVTYEVMNAGDWPTEVPFWQDSFFLTAADDALAPFLADEPFFLGQFGNATFLPAGASYRETVLVQLPDDIEGTFFVAVYPDSRRLAPAAWRRGADFDIPESDEENVEFSAPFAIAAPPQPDLVATEVDFFSPAFSGNEFTVTWTVENRGGADTDSGIWVDAVYLSDDDDPIIHCDDLLLGTQRRSGAVLAPGANDETRSYTARLPDDLRGHFFVKVFTDAPVPLNCDQIGGSPGSITEFRLEGNNVGVSSDKAACVALCDLDPTSLECMSCGRLEVRLSPAVDLKPVSAQVVPERGIPGHVLEVTWTVENINAPFRADAAWQDEVYLSSDDVYDPGLDTFLGRRTAWSSLLDSDEAPPQYTLSRSVVLPPATASGPWWMVVVVDAGGAGSVFEGFDEAPGDETRKENNNVASVSFVVDQMPTDLSVEVNCDTCPQVSPSGAAFDSITLAWRVTNSGVQETPVSHWRDRVYLSNDSVLEEDSDLVLTEFVRSEPMPLAAGSSYTAEVNASVPALAPGSYFLIFVTDARGDVFEAAPGEENNTVALSFEVDAAGVDLVVDQLDFNDNASSGKPVQISWRVTNTGNRAVTAPSFRDRVYLSADDRIEGGDFLLGSWIHDGALAAGASAPVSASFHLPLGLSGCFQVIVQTDAGDDVFETDEANNERAEMMLLEVELSPLSNLVVTSVNADAQATSGQTLTVAWTVLNSGPGPTNSSTWRDVVYLSRDGFLDRQRDLVIGFRDRGCPDPECVGGQGFLFAGESYNVQATFDVPLGASGPYFAFVVTDSSDRILERDEDDNQKRDLDVVDIAVPPLANLVVAAVNPPPTATLGEVARIEWQLQTTSTESVSGRWSDSLFLSSDAVWDLGDAFFGRFEVDPQTLPEGAIFAASGEAAIPAVLPGDYHVIARADVFNQIPEIDESDNETASVGTLSIAALGFDVDAASGEGSIQSTLEAGGERYFEMRVPPALAGQTLRVRLEHDSDAAWTELYVSFASVPTPGRFDLRFDHPAQRFQEVTIPAVDAGSYFVLARAIESGGQLLPDGVNISAQVVPFAVDTATPMRFGDQGRVTVEVTGSQFEDGVSAALVAVDDAERRLPARWTRVVDSTRLHAKFVLDPVNVTRGAYRLTVTHPSGESDELENVTIEAVVPPSLEVLVADPPPLREGAAGNVDCVVTNAGNVDAEYVFLFHVMEAVDDRDVLRVVASSPFTSSVAEDEVLVQSAVIPSLPPGKSARLTSTVRVAVGSTDIALGQGAAVFSTVEFLETQAAAAAAARDAVREDATVVDETDRQQTLGEAENTATWRTAWLTQLEASGLVDAEDALAFLGGADLVVAPKPPQRRHCFPTSTAELMPPLCDELAGHLCGAWLGHSLTLGAEARGVFALELFGVRVGPSDVDPAIGLTCTSTGSLCASCISWSVLRSVDPNEKTGTDGFGDDRFVPLERPIAYRVYFQNLPDATGPASAVEILDPLDPSLNPGSVRLGSISFGDQVVDVPADSLTFQTELDLTLERGVFLEITAGVDATRGELLWLMRSVDPSTGEAPTDATLGFLPPDDASGQGSGWVEYTALPRPGVIALTVVENNARIRFDINAPLDTGTVLNTIDADAPQSHVEPLAEIQSQPTFPLSWSGADVDGGSGLAAFTIFVAVDDGPFAPLVSDTTASQLVFTGEPGRRYKFYSRARDNAGNVEAAPEVAEATTTVSAPDARFRRGDANSDASLDISDPIFILLWLFVSGEEPTCLDAADANDDGSVDIADPIYSLNFQFVSGEAIPLPGELTCGLDPTPDPFVACVYAAGLCDL